MEFLEETYQRKRDLQTILIFSWQWLLTQPYFTLDLNLTTLVLRQRSRKTCSTTGRSLHVAMTAVTGFSEHSSLAQVSSSQCRPTFVLSFACTFVLSLMSSCTITALAVASQAGLTTNSVLPSILALVLHQPFVAGPGFSPIPAKLIHHIVAEKFIELNELLSLNFVLNKPELQLQFDSCLVMTSTPKKDRHHMEDIATWMEVFSIYPLVLTSHFPHQWKDLSQYKLLILRTYQQFSNPVWLAYDPAFCKHSAVTNRSNINVQLFNFHAAGTSTSGPGEFANESAEPAGASNSQSVCKSWNRGRCSAPYAQCCFSHHCSSRFGSHCASACLGLVSTPSRDTPKLRSSFPASPRSSRKSRCT